MIAPELRWPVVLFAIPFAAVLFGIFIVIVALVFPDDVVTDDYYRDGMGINRRIAQEVKAGELGVALGDIRVESRGVVFTIEGAVENSLDISFFHVTDSRLDREAVLLNLGGGRYLLDQVLAGLTSDEGVWYVEIASQERDWKVRRRILTPLAALEASDE